MVPFWRYYGGKYRAAPRYPKPAFGTIIEPFAGAAGYSLRYPDRKVVLIESYPPIAGIWRFLIGASAADIRAIPPADDVSDLPSWVCQEARWLVGFTMNSAAATPRRTLSAGARRLRELGRNFEGWCEASRERIATQVARIRHWQIIEGDYTAAPDVEATWFIDPPYEISGKHYARHAINYQQLGQWCRARRGQILVCENVGATWLPFEPFHLSKSGPKNKVSNEALWKG